jgi:hypothetical protein
MYKVGSIDMTIHVTPTMPEREGRFDMIRLCISKFGLCSKTQPTPTTADNLNQGMALSILFHHVQQSNLKIRSRVRRGRRQSGTKSRRQRSPFLHPFNL